MEQGTGDGARRELARRMRGSMPMRPVSDEGTRKTMEFYRKEYGRELTEAEAREVLQLSTHFFMLLALGELEAEGREGGGAADGKRDGKGPA